MPRSPSPYPTELELQILKILWQRAPQPGREVQAALADIGRKLARTSVITTLNTMVGKGYLRHEQQGKTFLFSPAIKQDAVEEQLLSDVVDRVFDGSTSSVLMKLFEADDLDADMLRQLRRDIDRRLGDT